LQIHVVLKKNTFLFISGIKAVVKHGTVGEIAVVAAGTTARGAFHIWRLLPD